MSRKGTAKERAKLWSLCRKFIDRHKVSFPEAACESDDVSAEAPNLVAHIGEIVGFYDEEDARVPL